MPVYVALRITQLFLRLRSLHVHLVSQERFGISEQQTFLHLVGRRRRYSLTIQVQLPLSALGLLNAPRGLSMEQMAQMILSELFRHGIRRTVSEMQMRFQR